MSDIAPLKMPKWGLSMEEGTLVGWLKAEGDAVAVADEIAEVETAKITNVCESPAGGILRRIVAPPGTTLPVGGLMGVIAAAGVPDEAIDAFVADYQARFTPGEDASEAGGGLVLATIEVDGRPLRIGRAGAGEGAPVVLIHGFSGDLANWMFNIEALAARGPVLAIDLPGHGGSTKDVGDASLAALAAAVTGAMAAEGIAAAHLVGHSLGGAVAAWIAAHRPEAAHSLTLIAPAYLPGGALAQDFLTGIAEGARARDLKPWLEMLLADPAGVSREMVEDVVRAKRLDGVEEALTALRDRMLDGADAAALQACLARIPAALVIASRADRIVGAPDESRLPAGFRVVWIDGAGHMPHLEKAAEINALLLEATGR
ncbi:MAG: acetoin dehydrogenase dihydrolipoyllysine-residue acetyltransferase subunit [Alphaproteobacteria bacterium]|nr:acetoin dehydrogenase dihydrolipoyllysine-residue acetyltransferase subunit [Alphaproteobacteria bacterium]